MTYKLIVIALSIGISNAQAKGRLGVWWRNFCENHLMAEHPYHRQLKNASTAQIVQEYRWLAGKFYWYGTISDELHMAYACVMDRFQNPSLSREERQSLREAIADYPIFLTKSPGTMP